MKNTTSILILFLFLSSSVYSQNDYSKKDNIIIVSVNDKPIESYKNIELNQSDSNEFCISNYSSGMTFKGKMKNLKVYSE